MYRFFLCHLLLTLTAALPAAAQQPTLHRQHHFKHTVPAGNYSGIAWLGGDRYAVVNDKSPTAGFYLMTIRLDHTTGDILDVRCDSFMTSGRPNRDEEGICYVPTANTVFVSGESDGQIIEYGMNGQPTGRRLDVPPVFQAARSNGGFESLTYQPAARRFWTTTEHTLKTDGQKPTLTRRIPNRLRLQSFGADLRPLSQYWYHTDTTEAKGTGGKSTLGVSGLAAMDDGSLMVLEREVRLTKSYVGSFVQVRIYRVWPDRHRPGDVLPKRLVTQFRTRANLTRRDFANYEGICRGPRLGDGRQVLILVADSQNRRRGLRDWFRSVVIPAEPD